MRRVWVLIFLACLAMLLPRAASAQSLTVELEFLVSEDSFLALVGELELQGASIDDARSLWGPYFFNLTQARDTYEAFREWPVMGVPYSIELVRKLPKYPQDAPQWDRKKLRSLYSHEQRRMTGDFFDGIRALAPHGVKIIDTHQQALHRRAIMGTRWKTRQLKGAHVDLMLLMDGLSRANPDSPLSRSHWPVELWSILEEYDRNLDVMLLELDRLYLVYRYSEISSPETEDPEELRDWCKQSASRQALSVKQLYLMRLLNQETTRRLAAELPPEAGDLLLKHANRLISPFAYRAQGWQLWIEQALKQDDLEEELQDTLLAWKAIYQRDYDRRIRRIVQLYEIRSTPEHINKSQLFVIEAMHDLREWEDRLTKEQLAFDEAIAEFENFDKEAIAKIRSLLGERAETISGTVLAQLSSLKRDLRYEQWGLKARERSERHREVTRPRHNRPFIDESEFKRCVEGIAFTNDERRAIFESLYGDFHDGFTSARETFREDRLVSEEKDMRENPTYLPSGEKSPLPGGPHIADWNQRWIKIRQSLERDFDKQVSLFLSEEEQLTWCLELRLLRRLRMIPYIKQFLIPRQKRYAYDLIELVNNLDLKPPEETEFSKLLDDCEMALDNSCRRFEDEYEAVLAEVFAAAAAWQKSPTDQLAARRDRIFEKLLEAREGILDVRNRYVPAFAEALDEFDRQRFLNAVDNKEFPWLYLDSPSDMCRAALRRDKALDDDQFLALEEQEKQLDLTRGEFRRRYLALMRRYDNEKDAERRQPLIDDIFRMALRRSSIERDACHDLLRLIPPHQHEELSLDIRMLLVTSR